jgi:hypothetical protein
MIRVVRFFLGVDAAAFAVASLIHAGILARGYEHTKASIAEGVIGAVLLLGFLATFVAPQSSRRIGLGAQAFALLGTLVGIFTIIIGVGPRSTLDYALHVCFVIALVTGLVLVGRGGR